VVNNTNREAHNNDQPIMSEPTEQTVHANDGAVEQTVDNVENDQPLHEQVEERSHLTGQEIWNLTFCLLTWACTVSLSTVGKLRNTRISNTCKRQFEPT
jgi:hypothetical protein